MGKPLLYSFINAIIAFSPWASDQTEIQVNQSEKVNPSFFKGIYLLWIALLCTCVSVNEISAQMNTSNTCPATTVNLMTKVDSTTKPVGTFVSWHTGSPATALNKVANPTSVGFGTYYVCYYDANGNCFGTTTAAMSVTINSCASVNISNVCPATSVNLMTKVDSSAKPVGTFVSWHTGTPATVANRIADPTNISTSGTYYTSYYDPATVCFGGTSGPLNLTINPCLSCASGTSPPSLSTSSKQNLCPAATADLSTITAFNLPLNTSLTWHSGTPATTTNKLSNVSSLAAGTYYAAIYDAVNNCYSGATSGSATTALTVTIVTCPTPNQIQKQNLCPATTFDLLTQVTITPAAPAGSSVSWHTGTPATNTNQISNPSSVLAGIYYPAYKDVANNCFSPTGTPVQVTINTCPPVLMIERQNICPANTVNLLTQVPILSTPPAGTTVSWHSGTPATTANEVSNPSAVLGGSYFPAYKDAVNNCYGITDVGVTVTIVACCNSGTVAPLLSATTKQNLCPATTVDLSTITANNQPANTILTWHGGTSASDANKIANVTALGAGIYYAAIYDAVNNCYSGSPRGSATTPFTVSIITCPSVSPIVKNNICPLNTVNLFTQVGSTTTVPFGSTLSWHTGTPATATNEITYGATATGGIYYPAYKDAVNNCYSPTGTPIQVVINPCLPIVKQNICPATTVDLIAQVNTTTPPVGTIVTWHTGTPATAANQLGSANSVSGGLYYPAFKNTIDNYYSPTGTAVQVVINICATTPCTNTIATSATTNPTTCGGNNGSITISGVDPSSPQIINYQFNGGVATVFNGLSDAAGKVTIMGLSAGSYTNIQVVAPCISSNINTALFGPAGCIAPIITQKDSTKIICQNISTISTLTSSVSICSGYPLVLGATASVTNVGGQLCITYVPKPGYIGSDSICIRVCEPLTGVCTQIKVPVTISPTPTAINDFNLTLVNVPVSGNVATNDTKLNVTDSFALVTNTLNGSIIFNPNGSYTYIPNPNFVGKDSVKYKLCTALNVCSTAWLYLTVTKPSNTDNLPPIVQNDVAQTLKDKAVTGNLFSNDFDPEKGPLTASTSPVIPPVYGSVVINTSGSYTYTPTLGFTGIDKFTYQVCDDLNQCTTAEVTIYITADENGITVNDKPNAQDDSFFTYLNVPIAGNIKLNDSDPNGNSLVYTITPISPVTKGTLLLNTNGTFTYTPNTNYYGNDQFIYRVCDNGSPSKCDTATVYIVVAPQAPTAILDINVTAMNTPVSGNILTNDNGNGLPMTLTTTPVISPKHGTIVIQPNGNYVYTPTLGFVGKDSVRYYICNAINMCDSAWIMLKVMPVLLSSGGNNKPIANDDVAQTLKNVPVSGSVLNNDLDPDGNILTVSMLLQPENGTVVMNPNGTFTFTPDPNFTGVDIFKYIACDAQGLCDTASVVIRINPDYNGTANDKPNAQDDAVITKQGIPVSSTMKPNDSDPNPGQTLTYTTTPIKAPLHGTVTLTAAGNYTYTPTGSYTGPDRFTYRICDNGSPSLCDTATVYILITPPTIRPIAVNDINVTLKNTAISASVLINDYTNGLSPLVTTMITPPVNGTAVLLANGTYTYMPNTNYVGKDSLRYTLCNGINCDTAWVYISILPPVPSADANNKPVANPDVSITNTNVPVAGSVGNNDIESDLGQILTFTKITNPINGTVVFNPDGTYVYTPTPGFIGNNIFSYKVCDSGSPVKCDTSTVAIKVLPNSGATNDKPIANDDVYSTNKGIAVFGNPTLNDTDPNGNALVFSQVSNPTNGTVTMLPNGTFIYTPNPTFIGLDKFMYKTCDNGTPSLCDTATIYIAIFPTPQVGLTTPDAINDIANTMKDMPVSGNVLSNDNAKGLPITASISLGTNPVHGTIVLNPNGSYVYTPTVGYVGKDSVRYLACNNEIPIKCDLAMLYINVIAPPTPQNDKPVATNDTKQTFENMPVTIAVLSNDFDLDLGDILTVSTISNPTNGTITLSPTGAYTYTPNPGFTGIDTFKYKICDNGTPVLCDTATVEIDVKPSSAPATTNLPPNAQNDVAITKVNLPKTGTVALNDSDPNVGQTITMSPVSNPVNGAITMSPNGNYIYTPNLGFVGNDSFTYKVCDNGTPSLCDSATVIITILPNDKITKPLAINDINVTFVGTPVSGNALTNDDGNGFPITSTLVAGVNGIPKHGTLTLLPNGNYTYTPAIGYVGKDSVQYKICNNQIPVECDTAWINLKVIPYSSATGNNAPIALPDMFVTDKGKPVVSTIIGNDVDPDGGPLVVFVVKNPTNGTLAMNGDGTFTYTPNPTFTGVDTFIYTVCDNGTPTKCDTASVTIKVLPIDPTVSPTANKKPAALDDLVSTQQGKSILASANPNDSDPDAGQTSGGVPLSFATISNAANGTVTMFGDGTYVYVPNPLFTGTDSFKYKICDSGTPTLCDSATVIITISPSTTKPDAVNDINIMPINTPTAGNVLANDNGKGLPLTVETITPPKHGMIVIDSQTGFYTYQPIINYVGKDSVQYKICNNKLPVECDLAWLFINVTPPTFIGHNNKPIASNDVNTTDLNTLTLGNVGGNDKDADIGQILTFTSLGNPPKGTVVMNPNGSYTYTPATGFFGKDTFKYKVCDNGTPVLCDTASVTITVSPSVTPTGDNRLPVANDDVVLGQDGKPLTANIATNDNDPDVGQTLTFTAIGGNPNVTISPTGLLTYTPTLDPITGLLVGGTTVVYTVCDNGNPSKCDVATIYLNITPSTTKPLAINDIITTPMNTSVSGDLLTNDDKKGLPVTITALTAVKHGIFALNPNGTYTYLPNTNFVGKDSIQYQICNNLVPAECSKAWLFITIQALPNTLNDKPVASPDIAQTLMNVPVTGKVTNNDTDPEGQPLVASLLSNPTKGTLVFNPDGTFTYTPTPGFVGTDKFKYKVCDNGTPSLCDSASVVININPKTTPTGANDAPFANDDAFSTTKNIAITASASPNDFEPNIGQTLAFTSISSPANGTVVMNPNGTFTYTPFTNYVGTDRFKYKVCDNGTPSLCDTATVYVTILPPPVATITAPLAINDINITPINTLVSGNILTNDDKKGLLMTIAIVNPAKNGTFTLGVNGAYTYLPNNNYVGRDSVRYEICNNLTPSECDQAWVYIMINDAPNATPTNPPIAMPDVNQTFVNKSVSGTVANNDSDPDAGQILSYTKLTNPTNGTVIFNGVTGAYTYTPNATFIGTDIFTYKVCDNGSPVQCASTNVTIKVIPDYSAGGNIKPVANDDAYSTGKGVGINGNASSNDYDPNVGQSLSYAAISVPANGTVTMNSDGSFSYAPSATFVGTDKFLYKICDNGSPVLCDTATIYISVTTPKVVSCITFNLKAILEGPYSTITGKMSNFLNFSGLLPGQTPTRPTGVATPNGQPYKTAPWNYLGTEVMPAGGYLSTVVDWVLVSLRTDSLTTTPTFRAAGLLHDDGTITFVSPCFTVANGSYYILVEHRNHMGAMSHQKINITSGTITYDFTVRDSYVQTNPPSFGQKLKGTKYVMYTGDSRKATVNDNYDINAADSNFWKGQSGIFDKYLFGDYNFDADVNNSDNTLWKANNGRFSGVVH